MADVNTPSSREERVRIGPVSLFALVVVLCLAVLSVLSFSTANAANTLAQRQARSVEGIYVNETAAQEFLADVDEVLVTRGAHAVEGALGDIVFAAEDAAHGRARVSASFEDGVVRAQFTNGEGRVLSIVLTIRDGGSYRIDEWRVTAVQNEEQPGGKLLGA